ncbi:hypothetical protein E2C01_000658 [Portunus trituberculatus]|uniref:Secreted protein n=1 Tax=Portunus trituberculatus TaxID=210409 RepID=A0A5B7CFM7_PORTR|nr:hypothetical protein [Portunus trituberculatus]
MANQRKLAALLVLHLIVMANQQPFNRAPRTLGYCARCHILVKGTCVPDYLCLSPSTQRTPRALFNGISRVLSGVGKTGSSHLQQTLNR